jgi:hypothetical protein
VSGSIWQRLLRRRRAKEAAEQTVEAGMSPSERRFTHESVEDHQAEGFVAEHLGGIDPERLLDDDSPRRD